MKTNLLKWLHLLKDAIFEDRFSCICCNKEYQGHKYGLCDDCLKKFIDFDKKVCIVCGVALTVGDEGCVCMNCLTNKRSFVKGYVPLKYEGDVKNTIINYKFRNRAYYSKYFGNIMYDYVIEKGLSGDAICAVPQSYKKKKERGYNQAELLGKAVAEKMNIPFLPYIEHGGDDRVQHKLSAIERKADLERLYFIRKENKSFFKNKKIILVDDIITTGATANAISQKILDAGATEVDILILAGTPFKLVMEK